MKKLFNRIILPLLVGILMVVALSFSISYFVIEKVNEHRVDIYEHVGDTVTYENDTVVIIDYSLIDETYTLSNGKVVSTKLYNK